MNSLKLEVQPDFSEAVDDPIATALRHAQRELRTVVATNKARRARLAMRLTPLLVSTHAHVFVWSNAATKTHPSLDKYKNACFAMLRLDPTVRAGSADMLDIALQLENC